MVFNSLTFLVFFLVVLLVHRLPLPWTWRKVNLLLASYLFYAAWNPPLLLLLIVAAVMDFFLAKAIFRSATPARRRGFLILSLMVNLGLLAYFKYTPLISQTLVDLLATVGVSYQPPKFDIILPLGISFYTFETISYLIDVYRGRIEPTKSFLDYSLFLTFFPHLVAGPIVRAHDFLPQCSAPRTASAAQLSWGLMLMLIGLFEKVVLADGVMAPVADRVFSSTSEAGLADAWCGVIAFSGQIFFDFAGYSTCGIGAALCLGFVLNDNFHFPYAAVGFSDFWRRWHMSLSSWLRDYLYIPLGGNRHGIWRTNLNLLLTMMIGGLWHGASWRFVAWGALHGFYLVIERGVVSRLGERRVPHLLRLSLGLLTFLVVSATWTFFRAADFPDACELLFALVTTSDRGWLPLLTNQKSAVAWLTICMGATWIGQWWLRESSLEAAWQRLPQWLAALIAGGLLIGLVCAKGEDRAFIYFQF